MDHMASENNINSAWHYTILTVIKRHKTTFILGCPPDNKTITIHLFWAESITRNFSVS